MSQVDEELEMASGSDEAPTTCRRGAPKSACGGAWRGDGASAGPDSRYVGLEQIGRGGMGRVLRAFDPHLRRDVALKEVRRDRLGPEATARLSSEARAMAMLSHPNVAAIFDVETTDPDNVVIVMEYVRGRTLREWLAVRKRSRSAIVERFVQAGRGLAAAHDAGLLHRDFKPENVLVSEADAVKVADFGLAKATTEHSEGCPTARRRSSETLTDLGTAMGTPRYMAPEQHRAAPLTPAADQYAFCVALWEALCGEPPFRGDTLESDKLLGPPRWPEPKTPRPIVAAIRRGLEPEVDDRWPTMNALLGRLQADRGRRWVMPAIGGVATLGLIAVGYAARTVDREHRCRGAREHLVGVWDAERRTEVESAFTGIEKVYAEDAWTRSAQALDSHSEDWVSMYTEVCEATTVRHEQSPAVMDLRMGCLRRARIDLKATVDVLAKTDAESVQRSLDVALGLRPLARCADIEALAADVEPPQPHEVKPVEHARDKLSLATTLHKAGRYSAAQEAVEVARDTLRGVAYGPVQTELALADARVLERLGQYEASAQRLEDALELGARWGQRNARRLAALHWMYVVGNRLQRTEDAMRYRTLAERLSDGDPAAEASLHASLAAVFMAQARYPEAEAEQRAALEFEQASAGSNEIDIAGARNNLAVMLAIQGRYAEAEAEFRAVLLAQSSALGPRHPDVSMSRGNLAQALAAQGKHADAEAEFREALALEVDALGPRHPRVASLRSKLSNTLNARGRPAEAEMQARAALTLQLDALGPEHPAVADSRNNLGAALGSLGKHAQAEQELRASMVLYEALLGTDHPRVADGQVRLAAVLKAQGRHADAAEELRVALSLKVAALGADHPEVVAVQTQLDTLLDAN